MLSKNTLSKIIDAGIAEGADFCEVYEEETLSSHTELKDSKIDFISGIDHGVGIRLFYGHKVLYTYTNKLDEKHLLSAIKKLALLERKSQTLSPSPLKPINPQLKKQSQKSKELFSLIKLVDQEARSLNSSISQCVIDFKSIYKTVQVANSKGVLIYDIRPYQTVRVLSVAEEKGGKELGFASSAFTGNKHTFTQDELISLAHKSGKQALLNLKADYAPAGNFPVIINKGFGGVIFHEACGHGLETTSVAEKASVFSDKLGKRVADSCVTAWDDGTIAGTYGFLNTDDEGRSSKKTLLIEKGILKNFMVDDMGSKKTGYAPTGSGRRESYRYPPASRMRNTFIAPGTATLEEMIKDIDEGFFAKTLGGGSVTPGTSSYNFSVAEGFWIKNGKLERPMKGASLIGDGLGTLKRIKKVGKDLELAAGICGSVSGMIPVTVGQPPILVSELTLGGRTS